MLLYCCKVGGTGKWGQLNFFVRLSGSVALQWGTVKVRSVRAHAKSGVGNLIPEAGWGREGHEKNMFKLISSSLDGDRACLFSDRCVERGWEELEETGMRRNGTCPFVSWATLNLRAASLLLCVCITSAGELLTMAAAGWGLSLDLDASNDVCGSRRRSSATEERWNTPRFSTPASCCLLSMSINTTMEPVATSNNKSCRLSYSTCHSYGSLYYLVASVIVWCFVWYLPACLSFTAPVCIMLFALHRTGVTISKPPLPRLPVFFSVTTALIGSLTARGVFFCTRPVGSIPSGTKSPVVLAHWGL